MTTKVVPGMLVATQTVEEVAREAASRIAKVLREALKKHGKASLALSGGETPRATYAQLAREEHIAWSAVDLVFVDERKKDGHAGARHSRGSRRDHLDHRQGGGRFGLSGA